jgi:hypothetical protein
MVIGRCEASEEPGALCIEEGLEGLLEVGCLSREGKKGVRI